MGGVEGGDGVTGGGGVGDELGAFVVGISGGFAEAAEATGAGMGAGTEGDVFVGVGVVAVSVGGGCTGFCATDKSDRAEGTFVVCGSVARESGVLVFA